MFLGSLINRFLSITGYKIVRPEAIPTAPPSPSDPQPGHRAPMTAAEMAGAYKVLSYLEPNQERLEYFAGMAAKEALCPESAFLRLLEANEVMKTLYLPQIRETCRPFKFTMSYGPTLFGYVWDRFCSIPASVSGQYEPEVQAVIRQHLSKGGVAIDIGGNIGCHSSFICELAGRDGLVLTFEPLKTCIELLAMMKEKNGYSQLVLHNVALSDASGTAVIHVHPSNLGGNALCPGSEGQLSASGNGQVITTARRDDIAKDYPPPDLIKIDVEGWEGHVFGGAWATIARHHPVVITEFAPGNLRSKGADPVSLLNRFTELGYSVRCIEQDGTHPVEDIPLFVRDLEASTLFKNLELAPDRFFASRKPALA